MAARSRTLRFKLLMVLTLAVVVVWSVLWFVAATVVDRHAERAELMAADAGVVLRCANRRVTGYPFRIEVRCDDGSALKSGDMTARFGDIILAAMVYQPSRLLAEASGPVSFDVENAPEVRADWALAHASARLDIAERFVERFDLEIVGPTAEVGTMAPISAKEIDINARRNPDAPDDLELALRIDDGELPFADDVLTLTLRADLAGGAALLSDDAEATALALLRSGAPIAIEELTVEAGDLLARLTGELRLGGDGLLDGKIELALAGHDAAVPHLAAVAPGAEDTLNGVIVSMLAYAPKTTINGREAKLVTLKIEKGRVHAGLVPLFAVPRLTVAQR